MDKNQITQEERKMKDDNLCKWPFSRCYEKANEIGCCQRHTDIFMIWLVVLLLCGMAYSAGVLIIMEPGRLVMHVILGAIVFFCSIVVGWLVSRTIFRDRR